MAGGDVQLAGNDRGLSLTWASDGAVEEQGR